MKIRKIQIKNYKVFDNVEFNFIDKQGKALDNIIIAGINGSGKTTLIKLLMKIFSNNHGLNYYKLRNKDINYFDNDEFIYCDKITLEIELIDEENELILQKLKENYNQLQKKLEKIDKTEFNTTSILIEKLSKGNIIELEYSLKKDNNIVSIKTNEFVLFDIFKDDLKKILNLKVCYFPAETKIYEGSHNFNKDIKELDKNIKDYDNGLVRVIDLGEHKNYVEKYILQTINEKIYENREKPAGEIIKEETEKINKILNEIKLTTKLVDVTTKAPIFESHNKIRIPINNLSAGEKQIFYRAVYLNSLSLQNSVIMVDEPELSLHPTWQSSINKLYSNCGTNNQVILATHSPHIISSSNPENLFVLFLNDKNGKLEVINMEKAGKFSKGVEPNRILKDIMGTPLRDYETQKEIDYISENLEDEYKNNDFINSINKLTEKLGPQDPFIIRLNHQLLLKRKNK